MNSASNFRTWAWLDDRDIYASTGEKIGEFENLIIDRGSGTITHVVVKSGGVLGLGAQSVVVPYGSLQWNATQEHFTMAGTVDSIRNLPSFSEIEWNEMQQSTPLASSSWYTQSDDRARQSRRRVLHDNGPDVGSSGGSSGQDQTGTRTPSDVTTNGEGSRLDSDAIRERSMDGDYQRSETARNRGNTKLNDWMWEQSARSRSNDPYGMQWDTSGKQTIEGEIKRVHRMNLPSQGEQVIVEVGVTDGSTKKVSLGPSWYVGGGETMLNRGDRVSIEVIPLQIATSARVNGREIKFRDNDGKAAWSNPTYDTGGKSYSAPYYQNILASTLKAAKLDCRGNACGTVNEIIFELESGEVAFLSIDPNQNFLGIADTKRLVPWSVASVSMDGTVRIDASKDMVVGSVETPSDMNALANGGADTVYRSYQVDQRTFIRRDGETTWNDGSNR